MTHWELLLGGLRPHVCGARVGDGIAALPLELATFICPDTHCLRRTWRARTLYQLLPDGRETPVSREELVSDLRKHGGYIKVDDRTYELLAERIRSVTFGPGALQLPLVSEHDIAQRLGPPAAVEARGSVRNHHYPMWSLNVAWNYDEGKLVDIVCGQQGPMPGWFGALDVLREWIAALHIMGPNFSPPKTGLRSYRVRYERLAAVLRAFQLGTPAEFRRGAFLAGQAIQRYPRAHAAFEALPEADVAAPTSALCEYFSMLLRYKEAAQVFFGASSFEEVSDIGRLALTQMRRANSRLWAALSEIDGVLEELISPNGERISEAELIRDWGFPKDDLRQLLADEW